MTYLYISGGHILHKKWSVHSKFNTAAWMSIEILGARGRKSGASCAERVVIGHLTNESLKIEIDEPGSHEVE